MKIKKPKLVSQEGGHEGASWWGRQSTGKTVWDAAVDRCIQVMQTYDDFYVSFSGGKDSTAVLMAALEAAKVINYPKPVRVVHFDEEVVHPETEAYTRRVQEQHDTDFHWYCLPVRQRNACSSSDPIWWPWAPEVEHLWVRDMPEWSVTAHDCPWFPYKEPEQRPSVLSCGPYVFADWDAEAPGKKRCAIILGIRAAESMMRRKAIAAKRESDDHWITHKTGHLSWVSLCYPVFDWTDADVWAAPKKFGWDYNRFYNELNMLGLPLSNQRVGTPFGEEPIGNLWTWHQTAPDLWDKMVDRVPGVASAYRLSTTAIYGRGLSGGTGAAAVLPELKKGQTYRELLRETLMEHQDLKMRTTVAKKCQNILNRHHNKTTDPILPQAPHWYTGISWRIIFKIAIVGDVKDRQDTGIGVQLDKQEKARVKYLAELEDLIKTGRIDACR